MKLVLQGDTVGFLFGVTGSVQDHLWKYIQSVS